MGDDRKQSRGLNHGKKEWSLFWGNFVEPQESSPQENVHKKVTEAMELVGEERNRTLLVHKKLLDVEMESLHKEIEELALLLSQQSERQGSRAVQIRTRLKELFQIEENLNRQVDLLNEKLNPSSFKEAKTS